MYHKNKTKQTNKQNSTIAVLRIQIFNLKIIGFTSFVCLLYSFSLSVLLQFSFSFSFSSTPLSLSVCLPVWLACRLKSPYYILTPKLFPFLSVASDVKSESVVGSFSDMTVTVSMTRVIHIHKITKNRNVQYWKRACCLVTSNVCAEFLDSWISR